MIDKTLLFFLYIKKTKINGYRGVFKRKTTTTTYKNKKIDREHESNRIFRIEIRLKGTYFSELYNIVFMIAILVNVNQVK